MKRVVFAILILIVIIVAGLVENAFVHKTFTTLDEKLHTLEDALHEESQESLTIVKDLKVWWEDKREVLEILVYSPDLRAFSVALAETEGSLECNDFLNAMSKCQSLIMMASNTHKLIDFNLEDII